MVNVITHRKGATYQGVLTACDQTFGRQCDMPGAFGWDGKVASIKADGIPSSSPRMWIQET